MKILLISLVIASLASWVEAAEISLRDSVTGLEIAGTVSWVPLETPKPPLADRIDELLATSGRTLSLVINGRTSLVVDGPMALRAEVPGYQPLHTVLRPARDHRGWTLMLDPLESLPIPESDRPDRLLISGWIMDADAATAVAGARVQASHDLAAGVSDFSGYFEFEVSAPAQVDGLPNPFAVSVKHPDYPDWQLDQVLAGNSGMRLQVGLGGPSPDSANHRQLQREFAGPLDIEHTVPLAAQRSPIGDQPPASITVGFADAGCTQRCCTGNCPHSCTFSLEQYVRRGLPNEWIASWPQDALAAGAVAYRSFGAWHVLNPPAHGAYDVCSSACCQVNEPNTFASTNQAVDATVGLMLIRDGATFRSEYSAQNNCLLSPLNCEPGQICCSNADISCGNGFVGSPATGWPCLEDAVGLDRFCFGHGRGMSQWGNFNWTQTDPPQNWKWQLNHYYNAQGQGSNLRTAVISRVLVIDAVRVIPGTGEAISLELDVRNLAAQTHEHVLIGASLRQPPGPFIDDPANDQPIVLPPGSSTVSRQFDIPAHAPDGVYDVYASLFIDVDQNQAISSQDLAQHLVVIPSAIERENAIFTDRFEP
jgi:hypothetical protein